MIRAILMLAILATQGALAADFSITVERPERVLDTASFTTFEIRVHSQSDDAQAIRMARLVNDLPDTSWHTSICSINICYPEDVSLTEPEPLEPRGMTGFTVHVITGGRHGDTARILVRLDAVDGGDSILQELVIVTAPPPRRLFRVEPEALHRSAIAGDTVRFTIWAYNEASDSLLVAVERADDYYPDSTWSSRLCVEERCFDGAIASPPPVLLENDRATWFTLMLTGRTPGQGRVVLRFNTMRGTEPFEHRFTLDLGAAGFGDDEGTDRPRIAPIPASDRLTILLGGARASERVRLRVVDVAGRVKIDADYAVSAGGRIDVDVRDLESGVYRYVVGGTLVDGSPSGAFVIAR